MSGSIYLGSGGAIELERTSTNTPLFSSLDPTDVNVNIKRFSFDFDHAALVTGDHVTIKTEDGSNLELVAGHAFPDWAGFVHADDAGGVRLYDNFRDALSGGPDSALPLIAPSASQNIEVRTEGRSFRYLAKVTDYQFTTSREAVDLTSLGEEHRRHYASGLISGQGSLTCFWDFRYELCDELDRGEVELAQYLAKLILRVRQGASFAGRFYLLNQPPDFVWYDVPLCVITNVAVNVSGPEAIRAQVDFVTSGPFDLRVGEPPGYLLLEDADFLLQEDGNRLELEDN